MIRVVGIDHLSIRVSDYEKSKQFYGRLFTFLGFELSDEYDDAIGWFQKVMDSNDAPAKIKSIAQADRVRAIQAKGPAAAK